MTSDGTQASASPSPSPLAGLTDEDLALLHRHWLWANQQKSWFMGLMDAREEPIDVESFLAELEGGAMVVWYGLLWAVTEALVIDRKIELPEVLQADVAAIADPLRLCRNAVMHVPRGGDYFDKRIMDLVSRPTSASQIHAVHDGLADLLLAEMRRRRASG